MSIHAFDDQKLVFSSTAGLGNLLRQISVLIWNKTEIAVKTSLLKKVFTKLS